MSNPEKFTVGWICAIETEYVAAQSFLDHELARPDILSPNDNNDYTLGKIGGHHVVIAVLPDGEYGTTSAASVARDMLHSFPNIRIGLMVGVGGGAPSPKHDIRLGDIVVSSSRGSTHGGVIQYDVGKELQDQGFQPTGFLNQPPTVLRTAVSGLKAQYERKGHQLEKAINTILTENRRMRRKYQRPDLDSDRLFESQVVHPQDNEGACAQICDISRLITRDEQDEDEDIPRVHYGIIASGNTLIKDAGFRDKLALEQNILCFEMEAAGLMNHFPCLVIRGICDYADSHKNKEWQGYAAMAAAAYTKDLLSRMIPGQVEAEKPAREILHEIQDQIEHVSANVDNVRISISTVAEHTNQINQKLDFNNLPIADGAEFQSYSAQHEDECLPGTREELQRLISNWIVSPQGKSIFWLNGLAGTGKSTISRTMARSFQETGILGASFFFKRGEADRGNATRFFPTITRQLLRKLPELLSTLRQVLQDDPRISAKPLKEQFDKLILQPLLSLKTSNFQTQPLVIVIDALDECENDNDVKAVLRLLPRIMESNSVQLRVFVTSRPDLPMRLGFQEVGNHHQDFILHRIPTPIIKRDISLFLEHKLALIRKERPLPPDWPGNINLQALITMSVPLFIFAATICRLFQDHKLDPVECLAEILKYQNQESKLDGTYLPVFDRILDGYTEERQNQLVEGIREVVGIIILLESPLSVAALAELTSITMTSINARLSPLHSILDIPTDETRPVRLFHLSFRDFLLDPSTRKKSHPTTGRKFRFWVDGKEINQKLTVYCLDVMRKNLKKNICNLQTYGVKRRDIDTGSLYLPPELQYACRYWILHLIQSENPRILIDHIFAFLEVHFLHWMEVMSILGIASEVLEGITTLQTVIQDNKHTGLSEFLHDVKRFTLKNSQIADIAPLQLYAAGLIFAPEMAITRKNFQKELPEWIFRSPRVEESWSSELQTLEGHSDVVQSVAFSPDGRLLASGSGDGTVKFWDLATGALKLTLEGSSLIAVTSIVFSPDGQLLAANYVNQTVKLWDPIAGTLKYTLKGLLSVAFSPHGGLLACTSNVRTIEFWDSATGVLKHTMKYLPDSAELIAFSPDGSLLVSGFNTDKTINLWDPATGVLKRTLECHLSSVDSIAFSPDSQLLACSSHIGKSIKIWDPTTGTLKHTLEGHSSFVRSVAFSPNGQLLASSSHIHRAIKIWDPATGALKHVMEGHSSSIQSVAFSPDGQLLASGSWDKTIKLWDPITGAPKHTQEDYSSSVESVAFSPDGGLLVSGSLDAAIKLWDTATGDLKHTLEGHSSKVSSVAFSPDGQLLASGHWDRTVKLWDTATRTLKYDIITNLKPGLRSGESVVFSPDGRLLASWSNDTTIKLWNTATGALKHILKGHFYKIQSVAFSPDGQLLASGSTDETIKLWDPVTWDLKHTIITDKTVTEIKFSEKKPHLVTNLGCFNIQAWYENFVPNFSGTKLEISLQPDRWIAIDGQNELWIPPDYRPSTSTVRDGAIAVGCGHGRVYMIAFSK
ncbi:unnamed protein product [Penicillium glandicola]